MTAETLSGMLRPTRDDEPDLDMLAFGRLVRHWRQERGYTQRRLAVKIGMNQSSISRLERGRLPGLALFRLLPILKLGGVLAARNRREP